MSDCRLYSYRRVLHLEGMFHCLSFAESLSETDKKSILSSGTSQLVFRAKGELRHKITAYTQFFGKLQNVKFIAAHRKLFILKKMSHATVSKFYCKKESKVRASMGHPLLHLLPTDLWSEAIDKRRFRQSIL